MLVKTTQRRMNKEQSTTAIEDMFKQSQNIVKQRKLPKSPYNYHITNLLVATEPHGLQAHPHAHSQ